METIASLFSHICGQNPGHTWMPSGVPLPFCQRCTGLYAGALLAAAAHLVLQPRRSSRWLKVHGFFLLFMVPFGFHWLPQESLVRTLTGLLYGCAVTTFLWTGPRSRTRFRTELAGGVVGAPAESRRLPGGAQADVPACRRADAPPRRRSGLRGVWAACTSPARGETVKLGVYALAIGLAVVALPMLGSRGGAVGWWLLTSLGVLGALMLAVLSVARVAQACWRVVAFLCAPSSQRTSIVQR